MLENAEDYFLSSKARYQQSQDDEDAAELFFAIRNMLNHGLDVEWDDTLLKMEEVLKAKGVETRESMEPVTTNQRKPGVRPKERLREDTKRRGGPPPQVPSGPDPADSDKYIIDPHLVRRKTGSKSLGVDEQGKSLGSEEYLYDTMRMVGSREAKQANTSIIPSRAFDVPALLPFAKIKDIDPNIFFNNTIEELKEKENELVPGSTVITYGHYLSALTGRPMYTGEETRLDPIQALHMFSDSRGAGTVKNSAHKFHADFLHPDSPHFVHKVEREIKKKNEEVYRRRNGKTEKSHLHDPRARDRHGEVVGDELPPDHTFTRMYEESMIDWFERNKDKLADDMTERELRILYSHWYDLQFDGASDDFIAKRLLTRDGRLNREHSRSETMIDPEFQEMRDDSPNRVGLLPLLLGLQLASPNDRKDAFGEFISYLQDDNRHPINLPKRDPEGGPDRHGLRKQNPADMRIEDLLDHMHTALARNLTAMGSNWMGHPLETRDNHMPPWFSMDSKLKESVIKDALSLAHHAPVSSDYLKTVAGKGALKGYDESGTLGLSRAKSMTSHMKGSGVPWDHNLGAPEDWDYDEDPMEQFEKFIHYLPSEFRKGARERFEVWLNEDPRGLIRGLAQQYHRDAAHENWALEPIVEGDVDEHEDVHEARVSPVHLWHSSLPKTGYNLYGPDIAEILHCLMPCLANKVRNKDMILFDTHKTHAPELDTEEYYEWLKGIGNAKDPDTWDTSLPFSKRGGMSGLAQEIDTYLRGGKMGEILKDVYERSYGHLTDPSKITRQNFISRVLSARIGEVLQEESGKETEDSFDVTEYNNDTEGRHQRSSLRQAREAGPTYTMRRKKPPIEGADSPLVREPNMNFPLGRTPINDRWLRMILPIASAKDAMFLRSPEALGVRPTPEALRALGVKEESQDPIANLKEAEDRRRDKSRQMVDRATILRGSSGGILFPYHMRGLFMPWKNLKQWMMSSVFGKKVANRATHDGLRDEHGLRRGAGLLDILEHKGVSGNRGLDAGQLHLLVSSILGNGNADPWLFEHDGNDTLVLDQPMAWGDKWAKKMASWYEQLDHPHVSESSLKGHLGVFTNDYWRNHPDVRDGRYMYEVTKETGDSGDEEYRLPMKKDEAHPPSSSGKTVAVPDLPDNPVRCPSEYEGYPQWKEPFSLYHESTPHPQFPERGSREGGLKDVVGTQGIYPGKPWMVVPKDAVIERDGRYFLIGEHPSKIKDEYSQILSDYDRGGGTNEHRDLILSLRREARRMAPDTEGGSERTANSNEKMLTYEFVARLLAHRHQAIRAVLPFLIARVASEHDPGDLEEGDLTDEAKATLKSRDFIKNYISHQTGDNRQQSASKYANMCYLYDKAAEYADSSHIESRGRFIESLEKKGFRFSDEEKESFLSRTLGSNARFGMVDWNLPEKGIDATHPFWDAFQEGRTRDIEGLNLLRSYVGKMYERERGRYDPKHDAVIEAMDSHFRLFGNLGKTGRYVQTEGGKERLSGGPGVEQPVDEPLSELQRPGQGDKHMAAIEAAQHHQKGRLSDISEPKVSDAPGMEESKRTTRTDFASRGVRAQNSLDLKDYFDEMMKDPMEAIKINDFISAIGPVIKNLVDDLGTDDLLLEHRPHQKFDPTNRDDVLREYTRLLYLRGRVNPNHRPTPIPSRAHWNQNDTGDNRPEGSESVGLHRMRLLDPSSVWATQHFSNHSAIPFRIEVGSGVSKPAGSEKHPAAVVREHTVPPWDVHVSGGYDDPSRLPTLSQREQNQAKGDPGDLLSIPYRTYHPTVINSAFGQRYCDRSENANIGAATEMTEGDDLQLSLDVLTDVDLLLKDEDRDKGKPGPVKAMHRIFDLGDLEYLRGFSDDWVVSSWPPGTRLIVEKKGKKVKARNSEGKAVSLPNEVKRGVSDAFDKNFMVDAVWDKEVLHIVDILESGDTDLSVEATKDRSRTLRAKFESTEKVVTPAPVNTKRVDGEGLERAVKDLMKEPDVKQVLLRDAESTYMRGESRHPKWVMLSPDQLVDVLVLSSSSDDNHLIGVGPLYDEDARAIGNRAVRYDGNYYMDVGSVSRSGLEEGMYITVKTSGISHSVRRKYSVYRLNAPRYVREAEGSATDSVETLDILRNRQEGNVPHRVRVKKGNIHIEVPTGHVVYETESYGNAFLLKGVDYPDDYTLRVVESQREYWSPLAAVLLRSEKEAVVPEPPANHDKKPKKVLPKRDQLLKDPEVVKTVVIALETVETMLKEKITWTGPKALGMNYGTGVESPHGPTKVTEPYDLPDHDPAARQKEPKACWCGAEKGEDCKQGLGQMMEDCPKAHAPKKERKPHHLEVSQISHKDSSA